jgi:adenylate kinase
MIIVLFGKPGAGKGTQAPLLARELGIGTLATGDVLRAAVREGTTRGREAKAFMDRGDLVPDEVILGIVQEALDRPEYARGAILDGVVRTVPQAEGLSRMLKVAGKRVDAVLNFDIDNEEIVRRLASRMVCGTCQTPHVDGEPGTPCTKPGCTGTLMRRKDDEPEAVRRRLVVYEAQTAPVFAWYQQDGTRVETIDATGSVDDVTRRALGALRD